MKITTRISRQEYVKLNRTLLLRRWWKRFIIIFALANVYVVVSHRPVFYGFIAWLYALGLLLGAMLLLNKVRSAKQYSSQRKMHEPVVYEFYDNSMKSTGESFLEVRDLSTTYKIQELNQWFLIYFSRATGTLIPKKDMTAEEVNALRTFLRNVTCNCNKKLK